MGKNGKENKEDGGERMDGWVEGQKGRIEETRKKARVEVEALCSLIKPGVVRLDRVGEGTGG